MRVEQTIADKSIYHKNLTPVVYVTGDVAGQEESPLYAIMKINKALDQLKLPEGYTLVILFDPIFQGLALSLMAGEVASLLLSRMTVPILFYLSERKKHGEGSIIGRGGIA